MSFDRIRAAPVAALAALWSRILQRHDGRVRFPGGERRPGPAGHLDRRDREHHGDPDHRNRHRRRHQPGRRWSSSGSRMRMARHYRASPRPIWVSPSPSWCRDRTACRVNGTPTSTPRCRRTMSGGRDRLRRGSADAGNRSRRRARAHWSTMATALTSTRSRRMSRGTRTGDLQPAALTHRVALRDPWSRRGRTTLRTRSSPPAAPPPRRFRPRDRRHRDVRHLPSVAVGPRRCAGSRCSTASCATTRAPAIPPAPTPWT